MMYIHQNAPYALIFITIALTFFITYTATDDQSLPTVYDNLSNGLLNDISLISDKKQKIILPELLPLLPSQNVVQSSQPPPIPDFLFQTPDQDITILKRDGVFLPYFLAQESLPVMPYTEPPPTQWKRFDTQEEDSFSYNEEQKKKEHTHNKSCKLSLSVQTSTITREHKRRFSKPKIHPCCLCDKKYTTRTIARRHIQEIHLTLRPYFCFLCAQTSATVEAAQQHLTTRHNIAVDAAITYRSCFNSEKAEQVLKAAQELVKAQGIFTKSRK